MRDAKNFSGLLIREPDYGHQQRSLDRLAKRLGVLPHSGSFATVVQGEDGRSYVLLDLIHAVLDRLDDKRPGPETGAAR